MLRIENLTKKYGQAGVNRVSFSAEEGTVTGIVGPNGVGKTTLLQCIAGILEPDEGQVSWNGQPVVYPAGEIFGYMPEFPAVPRFLTPRQTILYMLRMKNLPAGNEKVEALLETFQLSGFADKKNKALSQGMLKRVTMCLAFLGDPPVLLLDEPTNGLDTAGLLMLKDRIREAQSRGAIVLVSSHVLDFLSSINTQTMFLKGTECRTIDRGSGISLEEKYRVYFGL
ncbi:MAG: ABC transporter ATP-binding protein [Clostridia bacterium]|nr:ABC transporter ATP-binding protein [Clostridia bacterium]